MVVQHNISAMTANRYYGINNSTLGKSMEKLSSGYAINRAGDNAAGLAVSEKMRAQIAGLTQASKNAQDGISMVQTYEGALQETDSILQRMRTIAVQSANGSYQNDVDRDALQLEFDQLNDELNQIADTDFNGVVVLNGGVMSDGTVANNTTKIADRPQMDEIETTPNAAFTYKSTVNGTVDNGGNGSLSVNGVTLKLKDGAGSAEMGNSTLGKTTYQASGITVANGKVNGTVNAYETFKIDSDTNKIEIHGNTYNINNGKLMDSDGKDTNVIDGLLVTVDPGKSVSLQGSYEIKNNEVKTGASFSADGIGGVIDADGNGKLSFNGTVLTAEAGAVAETQDATDANITYKSGTNWTVGSNANGDPTVSGSITVDGSTDLVDWSTSSTITMERMTKNGTVNLAAGQNIYKATINGATLYTSDGENFYTSIVENKSTVNDSFNGLTALNQGKMLVTDVDSGWGTAATDNQTAAAEVAFAKVNDTFDGKISVEVSGKKYVAAGNDYKTNLANSKFLKSDGSVGTDTEVDVTGKTGVKLAVADGKFSGTKSVTNQLADKQKSVGSFKVSDGVSTSDSFNHGAGNLTFADNMTLQVGARSKDAVTFNFSYTTNGIGNLKSDLNASARGLGTDKLSVKNQEDANAAIDAIDNAINKVSMIRGTFGAIQNRLEHKINNIDTNQENITAAESRIRDTQMDQEMMKFTSAQILSQASQSMLAQANSLPQGVLQLLG